jgi:flagellar protein FlaG
MSSETIVTAIFLITAVVAAGVLASQIFPAIYTMSGSVSSSTHAAEQRLRTDIAIVNTFANTSHYAQVWVKNVGSSRIVLPDLNMSTVFLGDSAGIVTLPFNNLSSDGWTYEILGDTGNGYWDPMETLHITALKGDMPGSGNVVSFQIVLYDGTKRSEEFTVSSSP